MITVRLIEVADAEAFLHLCTALDHETTFKMLEPGERNQDVRAVQHHIGHLQKSARGVILVATDPPHLVGYIEAEVGAFRRNQHNAALVIGIRQAFTGQSIGTHLFTAIERWAAGRHLHRLELTVMVHNTAALALYQQRGFVIEGRRRDSLKVQGAFVDEYVLAKLLPHDVALAADG